MQFETRPLPIPFGQTNEARIYGPYPYSIPKSLPYDWNRLYNEKEILEKGLADCVTYLQVLRKKQAQNARILSMEPPVTEKKRKRAQQTKRHLKKEIKNRQRDEKAFLNNLQACKANILLADLTVYHATNASFHTLDAASTPTLYAPTLYSHSGSEAADLSSWNDWADETVVSPFQRQSSRPFLVDDVAPDADAEDLRRDSAMSKDPKRPATLSRHAKELQESLPVPPNTAQSQIPHSSVLSPAATVFKPTFTLTSLHEDYLRSESNRLSMSSVMDTERVDLLQKRRFTDADIGQRFQRLSIDSRSGLQHLPQEDIGTQMSRQRTNSL